MSEVTNNENFIGYDYKNITAKRGMEGVYADGYANFGWKLDESSPAAGSSAVALKFKRDRKIRNKAELSRLQRKFESGVAEIENLEKTKTSAASIAAYSIGLLGAAFMAGSVFSYLDGRIPLMIILAIPGFACWALSLPCYGGMAAKRTQAAAPVIDRQYDEIYAICEQAHNLLIA